MWRALSLPPDFPHSPHLPPPCPQATVLCDLLLLHILPKRHYYKQKKFKYAEDMGPGAVRDCLSRPFRGLRPMCLCWGASCFPEADFYSPQCFHRVSMTPRLPAPPWACRKI